MRDFWYRIEPTVRALLRGLMALVSTLWSIARPALMLVGEVLAALALLFEEWGWKPLSDLLARLVRFRIWARAEQWIAMLPPYGALAVFAVPMVIVIPLKLISVWLLVNGFYFSAIALLLGAKIASTAFIARIFLLTKPALMRISWFASAYNWLMPWKDAIFAEVRSSFAWRYGRMLKNEVRLETKQAYARWRPWIAGQWAVFSPRVRAYFKTAVERVQLTWRIWRPRLRAEMARWRAQAVRAWDRLFGGGVV